jgi:hypothetical protein
MRKFAILFLFPLFSCSDADIEPCSTVKIGVTETILIEEIGSPFQRSEEIENQKALMFKGKNISLIMIVELEKSDDGEYLVSNCNVM